MPNPYHDADGKFCSRGEMQGAIDTARENGDFNTYFRLRTDLERIESSADERTFINHPAPSPQEQAHRMNNAFNQMGSYAQEVFVDRLRNQRARSEPGPVQLPGFEGELNVVQYNAPETEGQGEVSYVFKVEEEYYILGGGYVSSYEEDDWRSGHIRAARLKTVTAYTPLSSAERQQHSGYHTFKKKLSQSYDYEMLYEAMGNRLAGESFTLPGWDKDFTLLAEVQEEPAGYNTRSLEVQFQYDDELYSLRGGIYDSYDGESWDRGEVVPVTGEDKEVFV